MIRFATILMLLFAATAFAAPPSNLGVPSQSVERTSIVALIANPEKYDGKPVQVIGAFRLEFEGNMICLHKDDLTNFIAGNCLWISLDGDKLGEGASKLPELNGKYVLVEGIFMKDQHGHMGMYAGIWRTTDWSWPTR
jgi:hypothetical protein